MRVRDVTSWQGRGSRKRPWTAINFEERLWWNCSTLMYTEHTKFYKHEDGKQQKSSLPFYDSGTTALLILMALLQIGLQCWQLIVYFRFYKTGFSLFCFKWKLSAFIACFNTSARSHILLLPSPLLNMHTDFHFVDCQQTRHSMSVEILQSVGSLEMYAQDAYFREQVSQQLPLNFYLLA